MRLTATAAAALLATCLGACSGPVQQDITYQGRHAQELAASNSMLGEACDGHDARHSLRLSGNTFLTADFDINRVIFGAEVPFAHIAGPVTKGTSQMAHPVFSGQHGPEACSGAAIRTIVRRENGAVYVDWVLELASALPKDELRPADPWRVTGRTHVADDGYARDTVAFTAEGNPMIAHLRIAPGVAWITFQNKERSDAYEALHPSPQVASQLPDERPGRTLEDVTNPAFKK